MLAESIMGKRGNQKDSQEGFASLHFLFLLLQVKHPVLHLSFETGCLRGRPRGRFTGAVLEATIGDCCIASSFPPPITTSSSTTSIRS
jgi:hypothetical protein